MSRPRVLKISGIYEIVNKENGKRYIGSAVDIATRKRGHFLQLRKGTHHSAFLQRAFKKYGEEVFEVRVVEAVPERERLIEREQYWIDTLQPEYNGRPTANSQLGLKHSDLTKEKLREYNLRPEVVAKKKAELTGHSVLPETRDLIKEARAKQEFTEGMLEGLKKGWELVGDQKMGMKGLKHSDETKRIMAEKATDRKHTPESLEKMRAAKLGIKQDPEMATKRIEASWGSKTDEEKAAIIAKRKATMEAKRQAK